ncbi:MAG TPA: class I SAM-dependent methyltransferase [Solirubrobacteraceae bacterium]|nr:class I SAM-dependent methyltransferase [Solirubrobacteraceae bacterium]
MIGRLPGLPSEPQPHCRICGATTRQAGTVHGRYSRRDYRLARCPACGYGFVLDPWLDYAAIYDERYYAGEGADPLVDYRFELEHPERSIRRYEWEGIAQLVEHLTGGRDSGRRWLDYGCGNGCLVRHLRESARADACGFDEGAIAREAEARGIPVLEAHQLPDLAGSFDVVTAIEVIEHTVDPVAELRRMGTMLRPGGLLYLTTGNAQPYADRLARWRYVIPEIHISLFEPRTLERALIEAGLRPERAALGPGFDQVLKFKVLKSLRLRRRSPLTDLLPARLVAVPAERVARLSEHPVGWAP